MATEAVGAVPASETTRRRKRKWDVPGDVITPPPHVDTSTLPPAAALAAAQAAAIAQKILRPPPEKSRPSPAVPLEVVSRDVIINDADPGTRFLLTKRATQDDIQKRTGAVLSLRGRFRPATAPPDPSGEKPLHLYICANVSIADPTEQSRAVEAAVAEVEAILNRSRKPAPAPIQQTGAPPPASITAGAMPFQSTLPVGLPFDPSFDTLGRIRGPGGSYLQHINSETGAEIDIRGGSSEGEPLVLSVTSSTAKSLADATQLLDNLMSTVRNDYHRFKGNTPSTASAPTNAHVSPAPMPPVTNGQQYQNYPPPLMSQQPPPPFSGAYPQQIPQYPAAPGPVFSQTALGGPNSGGYYPPSRPWPGPMPSGPAYIPAPSYPSAPYAMPNGAPTTPMQYAPTTQGYPPARPAAYSGYGVMPPASSAAPYAAPRPSGSGVKPFSTIPPPPSYQADVPAAFNEVSTSTAAVGVRQAEAKENGDVHVQPPSRTGQEADVQKRRRFKELKGGEKGGLQSSAERSTSPQASPPKQARILEARPENEALPPQPAAIESPAKAALALVDYEDED